VMSDPINGQWTESMADLTAATSGEGYPLLSTPNVCETPKIKNKIDAILYSNLPVIVICTSD